MGRWQRARGSQLPIARALHRLPGSAVLASLGRSSEGWVSDGGSWSLHLLISTLPSSRCFSRPRVPPSSEQEAADSIAGSIKEAEKACADGTTQDCAAAWDTVEELSAAASHKKDAAKVRGCMSNAARGARDASLDPALPRRSAKVVV